MNKIIRALGLRTFCSSEPPFAPAFSAVLAANCPSACHPVEGGPLSQQQSQGGEARAKCRDWAAVGHIDLASTGVCSLGSQLPDLSKNLSTKLSRNMILLWCLPSPWNEKLAQTPAFFLPLCGPAHSSIPFSRDPCGVENILSSILVLF